MDKNLMKITKKINGKEVVKIPLSFVESLRTGEDYVYIDKELTQIVTNAAGFIFVEYKYYRVKTRDAEYRIYDRDEYNRIVTAIHNPDVRFIKINNNLVNVTVIEAVEEHVGCHQLTGSRPEEPPIRTGP